MTQKQQHLTNTLKTFFSYWRLQTLELPWKIVKVTHTQHVHTLKNVVGENLQKSSRRIQPEGSTAGNRLDDRLQQRSRYLNRWSLQSGYIPTCVLEVVFHGSGIKPLSLFYDVISTGHNITGDPGGRLSLRILKMYFFFKRSSWIYLVFTTIFYDAVEMVILRDFRWQIYIIIN